MAVVRLRMRWDPKLGKNVEVPLDGPPKARLHIIGDIPDYQSPIDGRVISGRKQRREDLKRNGCRPHEGREQEAKQVKRVRAANDAKMDQIAERIAHRAWNEAPDRIRRILRGS